MARSTGWRTAACGQLAHLTSPELIDDGAFYTGIGIVGEDAENVSITSGARLLAATKP